MPTTRKRWQSEINQTQTSKSSPPEPAASEKVEENPATEDVEQNSITRSKEYNALSSTDSDLQPDPNPRSPKRQKRSSIRSPLRSHEDQSHQFRDVTSSETQKFPLLSKVTENVQDATVHRRGQSSDTPPPGRPTPVMNSQKREDNLSNLNSLASQVLAVLAKMSPTDALQLARNPNTDSARQYAVARSSFEPVRQLYSTGGPFLSPGALGLREPAQVDILRKANQAIYMSSIFTGEIGLRDMNQNFLSIFVPENGRLLKALGSIYLELKTQAFITAQRTGAVEPSIAIEDLFPVAMENVLLDRRPGAKAIAPSEQDFLKRMSSRREILLADIKSNSLAELPTRYRWEDFSREVSAYLSKNFDNMSSSARTTSPESTIPSGNNPNSAPPPLLQDQMQGQFSIHTPPVVNFGPSDMVRPPPPPASIPESPQVAITTSPLDDFVAQAARAAEIAMQGPSDTFHTPQPTPPPPPQEPIRYSQIQPNFQHYDPNSPNGSSTRHSPLSGGDGDIPHSSQTAPTQVLYERARQVATAKASSMMKKPVAPNQRRPWTTEEENALMTGLDRVKGPHWSQILAMYGPGGTVNESLKDRNQVQLKDKARNLKLFFLKSGIEVPYYLQYVTGDLKSRAPAQATKQEARERERQQNEGSKAHFDGPQGLTALSNGDLAVDQSSRSPSRSSSRELDLDSGVTHVEAEVPSADNEPGMLDVEAMIARAAAQASQSLEVPGWGA